ncbi:alpha/beta hydrolase [Actinophytocola sp.]|uniref:alpha/beta hydrolase n=1 Tax=Actinophytocola sp. TaxID=1872138 RepID=UPI00389A0EBA
MSVSLLSGWLPAALRIIAVVAVVLAVARRDRRWWTRAVPVALGAAAVCAGLASIVVNDALEQPEPLPDEVWLWLGVMVFALVALVWRGQSWRRLAAAAAVVLAAASAASTVNAFVGYYPTVGAAFGELTGQPVPSEVGVGELSSVDPSTRNGRIVPVYIPDTYSHFTHREEFVYLPPAWFRPGRKEQFPVIEMIGAEFSTPQNWIRAGNAIGTADLFAQRHHGRAPILVFADASGGFTVDTECVDGPHGNSEDHLVKDIPAYLAARFGVTPTGWGVAGWSMGGTCAVDLAVEHPDVFTRFLDISGDLGPNIGDQATTIATLYGGNRAAWAAHDPLTVLAHHPRYRGGLWGVFADGTREHRTTSAAYRLAAACHADGIDAQVVVRQGAHNWQFGAQEFAEQLPRLAASMTTTPT